MLQWRASDINEELDEMTDEQLEFALACFAAEDGQEYSGNTLYYMKC